MGKKGKRKETIKMSKIIKPTEICEERKKERKVKQINDSKSRPARKQSWGTTGIFGEKHPTRKKNCYRVKEENELVDRKG